MTVHLHHDTSAATAEEGADRRTRRFVWPAVAAIAAKCALVATAMFASLHQSQAIPEAKPK